MVLDRTAPLDRGEVVSLGERVAREMADLAMLCHHCTTVYMHMTDGRISKPNTLPSEVIGVAEDLEQERTSEAIREAQPPRPSEDEVARALAVDRRTRYGIVGLGAEPATEDIASARAVVALYRRTP